MDRLRAMWARLGKTERTALMIGVPLVAVAALYSASRRKPEEVKPANDGTTGPQVFNPTPFDYMSLIDQLTDASDDAVKKIEDATEKVTTSPVTVPTTPAPTGPSPGVLGQMSHHDLVLNADTQYSKDPGGIGPYLTEIHRRFATQAVGPDGAISVNGAYWRKPDGNPRAIWYAAAPGILALLPEGSLS